MLQPLNFEAQSEHSVTIRAEDDTGYVLESTFDFDVLDENESPTDLLLSSSTIPENLAPRSMVATFSATDPDADDVLTYSLLHGDSDTDNRYFYIVDNQAETRQSFDFEQQSSYLIRVEVSDQTVNSQSKTLSFPLPMVMMLPMQSPDSDAFLNLHLQAVLSR